MKLHLFNKYHLGDCMFVCIYFYAIQYYIEANDIEIVFYINPEYISQIREFIPSSNISICSIEKLNSNNNNICTWIGSSINSYHNFALDSFLSIFLSNLSTHVLKIPITMTNLIYEDLDLLERYANLDVKFHDLDILLINSNPLSGQVKHFDETKTKEYIIKLHKKYKIITTKKVVDIPCTLDDNLTIKDIAAVSTRTKIIMAINTGPLTGLFNKYTFEYVYKFYFIDDNHFYSWDNFQKVDCFYDIGTDELDTILY
jgi:hypothetical protein